MGGDWNHPDLSFLWLQVLRFLPTTKKQGETAWTGQEFVEVASVTVKLAPEELRMKIFTSIASISQIFQP